MADETQSPTLLDLTAEIVAAHVANNHVATGDLPGLIQTTYAALSGLGQTAVAEPEPVKPQGAVSARKSIASDEHIISMIDGKPYKMLRRHITKKGYTPESYREAFGLPRDYPMVARNYAEARRTLAKAIGLGRTAGTKVATAAKTIEKTVENAVAPKTRGRKPKLSGPPLWRRLAARAERRGGQPNQRGGVSSCCGAAGSGVVEEVGTWKRRS